MDMEDLIKNLDPNNPAQVKALQQSLQGQGYDVTPDGKMGAKTSQAINKFRAEQTAAANRALDTKKIENAADDKSWQNQLRQAAPWLTIPFGMAYGTRKAGQIEARQTGTQMAQQSGQLPNAPMGWGPTRRFMGRFAPYAGAGSILAGEGIGLRNFAAPLIPSDTGKEFATAAGTGLMGAAVGVTGKGLVNAFTPQPVPSPMGAPQMPGGGPGGPGLPPPASTPIGPPPPPEQLALPSPPPGPPPADVPEAPPPAPPEPEPSPLRRPSDRLISAARAAGAPSGVNKTEAADHLLAEGNITPENRTAVASELGVKSGPNYAKRIADRIALLKTSRTPLAIVGVAGALGYDAGSSDAEAAGLSPEDAVKSGVKGAAISGGAAGGTLYGLSKLGPLARAVTGEGLGWANMPATIDAATDYPPEELNSARNWLARNLPAWAQVGAIKNAADMSQVPQRNPLRAPMGMGGIPMGQPGY